MILQLKSKNPLAITILVVVFLLLKTPFFFYQYDVPTNPTNNWWTTVSFISINNFLLEFVFAQLIIIIQAIWLNYLFNVNGFNKEFSFVPLLYFIIASCIFPSYNVLSAYHFINLTILVLLQLLFALSTSINKSICLLIGIVIGLIILQLPSFVIGVPIVFAAIFIVKPFQVKDYLLIFFGMLLPLYFAFSICYIFDIAFFIDNFSIFPFQFISFTKNYFQYIPLALMALYVIFSFISLRGVMFATSVKTRKNLTAFHVFSMSLLATAIFTYTNDTTVFSILLIPITVYNSFLMLRMRLPKWRTILHYALLLTIIISHILYIFY
ncbi:MAG: hypothetical protein H6553_01330 [Chitinophagales bacterium]|nr:hypothetical protein [Chitinophagales bacterium]